jgi:hypothetical protein
MAATIDKCAFCGLTTTTRGHHVTPKSKGGTEIVQTCESCESFIHKTWSHNELRDFFNTVESVLQTEKFQKFLKWRLKQPVTTIFKSVTGKFRDKRKYS